jgi:hypothetical protein
MDQAFTLSMITMTRRYVKYFDRYSHYYSLLLVKTLYIMALLSQYF